MLQARLVAPKEIRLEEVEPSPNTSQDVVKEIRERYGRDGIDLSPGQRTGADRELDVSEGKRYDLQKTGASPSLHRHGGPGEGLGDEG